MGMNFKITESQRLLSKTNEAFLEFVEKNPGCLDRSNFNLLELNDKLFTLQPWPTYIDRKTKEMFRDAVEGLFSLILSVPGRFFNYSAREMSEYYGVPEDILDYQVKGFTDEHIGDLVGRGDFLYSSQGLKCLEYNVTANLGGWQIPIWESFYLKTPLIDKFLKEHGVELKNEDLHKSFFNHIIDRIYKKNPDTDEMNIIFIASRANPEKAGMMDTYFRELYSRILKERDEKLKGILVICDYNHLDYIDDRVFFKGHRIHAAVELYSGFVAHEMVKASRKGNIVLINGPVVDFMSNKLNLALLSDSENSALFTKDELDTISKYIPWTRKVIPGKTTYRGEKIEDMATLLKTRKDDFVIKPSMGYGGTDICIGKKTEQQQWEEKVNTALPKKNWVVQEYIEPGTGVYQVGEQGADIHDMVWGFFVFGKQHAGSWLRVMPRSISNKGVINCHQGATVSIIFEVEEKKQ